MREPDARARAAGGRSVFAERVDDRAVFDIPVHYSSVKLTNSISTICNCDDFGSITFCSKLKFSSGGRLDAQKTLSRGHHIRLSMFIVLE